MRKTLPTWARAWPVSLDVIRKVIRRRADLQRLGEVYGPLKLYSADEAELIRRAVENRDHSRRGPLEPVGT